MTVHQHRATATAASGTTSTTTLKLNPGLLRQVLITANTSTTVFRANLVDYKSVTVANWGFSQGQINELGFAMPVMGQYILNITNASADDTFTVLLGVEE